MAVVPELSFESSVVVADGVIVRRSQGAFTVAVGHREVDCGSDALLILETFSTSRSLASGMDLLTRDAPTPGRVAAVLAQVRTFMNEGVLTSGTSKPSPLGHSQVRFDSAPVHIRMLNDRRRTSSFQDAIRRTVTADDVVVDIGTGTGVLAITAARAGARHVYAIERTAIAEAAQSMFDNDDTARDRVTLIRGQSTEVELPEAAHVLVSEIIGDDPLGEHILETFWDARRFLVEQPRFIPCRLDVYGLALEIPNEMLRSIRFDSGTASSWTDAYGMDFSPLVELADDQEHRMDLNSFRTKTWKRISEGLLLSAIDFSSAGPTIPSTEVTFRAERSGLLSGLLLYFDADLGNDVHLSLHPDAADAMNSWANRIHVLGTPLSVSAGDLLTISYSHRAGRSNIAISPVSGDPPSPSSTGASGVE